MSTLNFFKNKRPMSQRKKGLLAFILIISILFITLSLSFFFFGLQLSKDDSQIPSKPNIATVYISCEHTINKDNPVECTFALISSVSSQDIKPLKSNITIRGETSATYPKKGYRLEFSKKKALLGMRNDDDWQLFAMYDDITRMRLKLSFELWRSLLQINPIVILPKSEYVNLYLNGEYQGLYLLAENNDRKLFGFDEAPEDPLLHNKSSLIFQAKYSSNFKKYEKEKWEQDYPNEDEGYFIMDEIMTNLTTFVNKSTPDLEFFNLETGIYSRFNKINLIDFFLFNFFILHNDFWDKNYFILRNSTVIYPNNFSLLPWDFDGCFGQFRWTIYSASEDPESEIRERNYLYDRLLGNNTFREDCKKRWFYIREKLWSVDFILDILSHIYEDIENILEIETTMWEPEGAEKNSDVEDYIDSLFQWIPERLEFCDSYFLAFD